MHYAHRTPNSKTASVPKSRLKTGPGLPRYLGTAQTKVWAQPRQHADSETAAKASASGQNTALGQAPESPQSRLAATSVLAHAGPGQALSAAALAGRPANSRTAHIHEDAHAHKLTNALGANAVTIGQHIFFAPGRFAPQSSVGQQLLNHELAHVRQQDGQPRALQCDLARSIPVPLGVFGIDMHTQAATANSNPGLRGTLDFDPDPNGPYASEIGLIQAINVTRLAATATSAAGMPVDWRRITDVNTGVRGTEAGRMELMTPGDVTGSGGAPAGWYIDSLPSAHPRGSDAGPNYAEHFPGRGTEFGWLRSPTDHHPASLFDFPNMSFDAGFQFETVAKGTDNQTQYGALHWGFEIRAGVVDSSSEYAYARGSTTSTFDEALERFRGYYVHEPVVLYFDFDQDIPATGEEVKLQSIPDYLRRYPDVVVNIDGWADVRGGEGANQRLAQRRANSVRDLLLLNGIDAGRIVFSYGFGATDQFSAAGTAPGVTQPRDEGRLRANRRVVVSFEHTVSNHPMVMR